MHDPFVVARYLGPEKAIVSRRPSRAASTEVLLEVEGLSAGYNGLAAVRELDLTVHAGEIVALLGPNGAGKSSTLLTLVGELSPLAGEVRYLGRSRHDPLHRRVVDGLGFVPEGRSVFHSLTVSANLRLGRGPTVKALDLFPELRPLLGRKAASCSGGEQQMLALARALSARPRLLLIDELSLGIAPMAFEQLLNALRIAADEDGMGVLVVEQQVGRALEVADRVCVLNGGRVVLERPVIELLDDPTVLEGAYRQGSRPES
jgi:branched-chain amino acid transport system ATP-binding protein